MDEGSRLIRIKVLGLNDIVTHPELSFLLFKEYGGERLLTFALNKDESRQTDLAMRGIINEKSVMASLLHKFMTETDCIVEKTVITSIFDGQQESYVDILLNGTEPLRITTTAPEGVIMSLMTRCPLYVEESLLDNKNMSYDRENGKMSLSPRILPSEMIKDAIEEAVRQENYRAAEQLTEILKQRESK